MAKLTILEALQLSLNATKKYVDDKIPHYNETLKFEISGEDYSSFMNNNYFNMNALNIDETKSYMVKNKFDINDNEEYTFKFVYDKENDVLINEDNQLHIYNHKSYNGTNLIEDVNSAVLTNNNNITPMTTVLEGEGYFRLYEIDKVELDSNCLPDNVNILNSLTVGTRIGDIGGFSVSEGDENIASGYASHAEGSGTTASGLNSHAEGTGTTASDHCSHAEGFNTTASGLYSHAEGSGTTASGILSHTEGLGTKAQGHHQHVQGKYNIENTTYAHIVGNGTSDTARSNAHTLDWNGNGWYQGKLSQDGTPTEDKDLVTKKYVDEKVAEANASGGYTHPDTHPASMITGLHTVATSGDYNDLTNKPITILTAAENEFIILSELAVGAYLITGLVKYMSTDTAPQPFNNSFVEVLKNGSITYVADPFNVSVIDSNYNSIEVAPRINMQADWNTVDATDPSYINNKPTIPTVTNDLTNELKANYDAAYTHSTSAHAPVNAQKNSDITKAEIEAKLTGNITSHTHSQYLTSIPSEYITEQELTSKGYATESQINSAIEAAATTHEEVKTTVNQILGGAYIE